MKLFMRINSLDDCSKLQWDLNNFVEWSQLLGITLNLRKVSYVSNISRVIINVVDIGFKFNDYLDSEPYIYIDIICYKVFKMFGFIKSLAHDYKLGLSLKILFCSFVCPILGTVIWNPQTSKTFVR